jgi:hypothetical protein
MGRQRNRPAKPILSAKQQRFASCLRVTAGFPWTEKFERSIRTLGAIARDL